MPQKSKSPTCGHSACRQNWIDTGDSACVRPPQDSACVRPPQDPQDQEILQTIIDCADAHEDASPDMGFGDLENALRAAWEEMTHEQRMRAYAKLDLWFDEDEDEDEDKDEDEDEDEVTTLTLHSDGMGNATEEDFDAWTSYVTERIDARAGMPVKVERARFGESGDDVSRWDPNAETLRDILKGLWEEWCAAGAPRQGNAS